jgi:hypothetical protein
MHPIWWKRSGIAALVVTAYLMGSFQSRDKQAKESSSAAGATRSRAPATPNPSESKTERAPKGERLIAGFKSAVPFAPGGAREWFLTKGQENCGDSFTGILQLIQNCTTLDERAAEELAVELREICKLYEEGDPAMRAAFDGDDLQQRGLAAAVFRLSQLNPGAALRFLEESPDIHRRNELVEMVFANASLRDPAEAETLLAGLDTNARRGALEGAMEALAGKDAEAAFKLLSRFDQPDHDNERRKFVERIAKDDPAKALEYAESFVKAGRNPEIFASIVEEWIRKDRSAGLAWAEAYRGPGEIKVKSLLIKQSAASDPRKAAENFARLGGESANFGEMGMILGREYAAVDLPGARVWVESLPEGQARDHATEQLVASWLKADPFEAAEWIDKMPQGRKRDDATMALVDAIRHNYPQEALDWASSVPDEKRRAQMQEHVFKDWDERDPEAAEAARQRIPR